MFSSNHSVHFVFDNSQDLHYTDTLLRLSPEAYLWYELRNRRKADIILFLHHGRSGLRAEVFDTDSASFLKPGKRGIFRGKTTQPAAVAHSVYSMDELNLRNSFPEWFLKQAGSQRKKAIALAVSYEAFRTLCSEGANPFADLPGNCMLLLRLPVSGDQLETALLNDQLLHDLFPGIRDALDGSPQPLMTALQHQLGDQMVCFHQQSADAANLLLHHLFVSDETDTPAALADQAACLHQCRIHRRLDLIDPSLQQNPTLAATLRDLESHLQQPGFRSSLRSRAAALRQAHPFDTMADALRSENLLPDTPPDAPVCTDALANKLSLLCRDERIPAHFQHFDLERICRDLSILWNKTRNSIVLDAAGKFCAGASRAIDSGHWEALNDALYLLHFCADQICASESQNQDLTPILKSGLEILDDTFKIASKADLRKLFRYEPSAASLRSAIAGMQMVHDMSEDAFDEYDQFALCARRTNLQQKISEFYKLNTTPEKLPALLAESQARYRQAVTNTERYHQQAQALHLEEEQPLIIDEEEGLSSLFIPDNEPVQEYDPDEDLFKCRELSRSHFLPG